MSELRLADDFTLPAEAVTETFAILAKRGAGKTFTASVLMEEFIGAQLPVAVIDPVGVWWGLRSSADGNGPGLPVVIFGGDHADLPLPETAGATVADLLVDDPVPIVLDLSQLSKRAQRRFVTDFMERLYHRNRHPLHLVVDEADLFAPQRGGADVARLLGAYEDVVRRGRAHGLGCTSITQRPATLHKDILTQSEVLIALRMTGVRDVQAIDEWVRLHAEDEEAREVKASLASLPVGTAWIWSPGWLGVLQRVRIRMRRTFDSSATPKPGQRVVEPRRFAAVDLERLRTRLAALEPEVKTDEAKQVASWRAEVGRLRRELAEAQSAVKVQERVVEVPVLNAEMADHLRSIAKQMDILGVALNGVLERFGSPGSPPPTPVPTPTPAVPQPRRTSRPAQPAAPTGEPTKLARAERAILTVLVQHGRRTTTQVALLTGYSHKSGGFRNALSSLRSSGYIEGRGEVEATAAGIDALGQYEPLPSGPALVDWWYRQLGKAERAILAALVEAWPAEVATDEIAARTEYSSTSGGFRNALSRLRSLELAAGRGALRAADVLGEAARS